MSSKIVKLNGHKLKAEKITRKVDRIVRSIEKLERLNKRSHDRSVDLDDVVGQSEQLPCDCDKYPTYFDDDGKPRCTNCKEKSWLAR